MGTGLGIDGKSRTICGDNLTLMMGLMLEHGMEETMYYKQLCKYQSFK